MEDRIFLENIKKVITRGTVKPDEPMKNHTSFGIGGPAKYYVQAADEKEIAAVLRLCHSENVEILIVGNGSNLLVSDGGFDGLVLKPAADRIFVTQENGRLIVRADAGVLMSKLSMEVAGNAGSGFEFASGIPGSLGGGIFMNAGAYGGQMADVLVSASVMGSDGSVRVLYNDEMDFSYRHTVLSETGEIVLSAELSFEMGNRDDILELINGLTLRRREKQPLEFKSAGSMFKRPVGFFAGKLIEDAGLKGYRVGDAQVSEKHAGFVINLGMATASDVKKLVDDVIDAVYADSGIRLEPEVRFIGFNK